MEHNIQERIASRAHRGSIRDCGLRAAGGGSSRTSAAWGLASPVLGKTVLTVMALFAFASLAFADAPVRAVSPDLSRAKSVHRIPLYDENGSPIRPGVDNPVRAMSQRKTCGYCHDYDKISSGWHFDAAEPNVPAGRPGEPWLVTDVATGTQLPVSARGWAGTFKPEQVGLTPWQMMLSFGRHWPGGGVGERRGDGEVDAGARWEVSGNIEINCLGCHNADFRQDQNHFAEHIARQNFRWAGTAASGLAFVEGNVKGLPSSFDPQSGSTPDFPGWVPKVHYDASRFNFKNEVFFDVPGAGTNDRCYACHTAFGVDPERPREWQQYRDVHIARGMACGDCHRNGLDHKITRNYEGDATPGSAERTCRSCHMGDESARRVDLKKGGHLAAPRPRHAGLPKVHLDKLSCTACHSGPMPGGKTTAVQTSMAHGLGVHAMGFDPNGAPYIQQPVFAKGFDGKLAPHRMVWPSYWARLEGTKLQPLTPAQIVDATGWLYRFGEGRNPKAPDEEKIIKTLRILAEKDANAGEPVYVTAGKIYHVDSGKLAVLNNPALDAAAKPYFWAMGHDVRPAAQSLGQGGANGCLQCHSADSGLLFGKVPALGIARLLDASQHAMSEFSGEDESYQKLFASSFVFRPWLKAVGFGSSAVLLLVLLAYGLPNLRTVLVRMGRRAAGGRDE